MSLRTRIAAVSGLAVALAVVALAGTAYVAVRAQLRGEVADDLRERAARLLAPGPRFRRGAARRGLGPRRRLAPGLEPARVPFGGAEGVVQLVGPDGTALGLAGGEPVLPVGEEARALAAAGEGSALSDLDVGGAHLLVLTAGAGRAGAVQVARPLDEVDRQLDRVLLVLVVVGLAGIGLGAALGGIVARAALAPVRRFTRASEALGPDADLSRRLEGASGRDELARLARSFNRTLDALERSVEAQRHLVADASHELRTPIASLRANLQVLLAADRLPPAEREALRADLVEELDALTALVGDVVELARGAKLDAAADDVRLDRVVEALCEQVARRAGATVAIERRLEPTVVSGDAARISRAVSNLLENAAKWSPPGGRVEVELAGGALTVRDHGPGFAEADLPHVFERFYRSGAARGTPGSGLGLAIVRQAAEAHGGTVEAGNAPGGGALLRVTFGAHARPEAPAGAVAV